MLTRPRAALIAAPALAAVLLAAAPAALAVPATAAPAACGAGAYPAGYGIWCPGQVHLVIAGDTLPALAGRYLGSSARWPQIWILGTRAPQNCGSSASPPGPVHPGQVLVIPDGGQQTAPPWCQQGTWRPGPAPSVAHQTSTAAQSGHAEATMLLVVLAALAALAAAALALTARRRNARLGAGAPRRGLVQPGAVRGPTRTAAAQPSGWQWPPPGHQAPPDPAERPSRVWSPVLGTGETDAPRPPGQIPVGIRGRREVTADLAALGGLGLTGPGAEAAARAILATCLSLVRPGPPGLPAPVIVPADTNLLPAGTAAGADLIGQPPTLAAALDDAEELAACLARAAAYGDPDDSPPGTAAPVVVFAAAPGPAGQARLRDLAADGLDLGIIVVVLGTWHHGVTCEVAADGSVTAAAPPSTALDGVCLFQVTSRDLAALAAISEPAPRGGPPDGTADAGTPGVTRQSGPLVQVSVLGPLRITAGPDEITAGYRKARELIAYLAVCGPGGATAGSVAEALWPGASPGHSASQRKIALRKARDLLRRHTGATGQMWILLAADRYRLDPGPAGSDLWQFSAALSTARAAADDAGRLAAYRHAASLYRGPLCDGSDFEWTESHAEQFRRGALDAWTRIAEILQDTDPEQALAALEAAVTHDAYNEDTYLRIMRLQTASGRADAARRTYQLLLTRLHEIELTGPRAAMRRAAAELLGESGPQPTMTAHPGTWHPR